LKLPFKRFESDESLKRYEQSQKDIVKRIIESDRKVVMVSAPTGIGKSIIGMMSGHLTGGKVNYVCSDKSLQAQLVSDFPEAKVLMGRNNYTCNLYPHLKADTCLGKCAEYEGGRIECEYYDRKMEVARSRYRILNTHYLLYEINYSGLFASSGTYIIDEADILEDILLDFVGLTLYNSQIRKYGLSYPKITVVESWIEWAEKAIARLRLQYNSSAMSNALNEEFVKADRLIKKLGLFLSLVEDDWIYNKGETSNEFKPVWLTPELTHKYLWNHGEKFILMSASLPSKAVFTELLGLEPNDVDYIEVGSPFEVHNRLIKYRPITDMGFKNKDKHYMVVDEIRNILDTHTKEKGIIHSQSYALTEKIMDIGNPRLVTHTRESKGMALESFLRATEPLVLVTPSSTRGLSLDGELGRFAVFPKVPFGNLKDKAISARLFGSGSKGNRWYLDMASRGILQGAGRIVRGYDDYGVTYILDSAFDRVRKFLPQWFKDAIVAD